MSIENVSVTQSVTERAKNRLARLSQDVEEDEVPPTAAAQRSCLDLLVAAAGAVTPSRSFPFPHLSTAGEGDLSCEWHCDNRVVIAAISPEGVTAVYRIQMSNGRAAEREIVSRPTADELGETMEWLLSAEIPSA